MAIRLPSFNFVTMLPEYQKKLDDAKKEKKSINKLYQSLAKKKPKDLDATIHQLHEETFEQIDCLNCANCCKTTGPLLTDKDIDRIAKHLRLKPQEFISRYLYIDEDEDYVFQKLPCVFLDSENYCMIYDVRPKACRAYPHTDQVKMHTIASLTAKNASICPAVSDISFKLKDIY